MKLAILDDWFDTLRGLPCFARLDGIDVTVFTDHEADLDRLAARLQGFDAVVLFRERTAITRDLIERLPDLKLISQRSVYPHIDVEACSEHMGARLLQHVRRCLACRGGTDLCPDAGGVARHSAADDKPSGRRLADRGWQDRPWPPDRHLWLWPDWQAGVDYADAFGMKVVIWGSEAGRARAAADGRQVADSREAFFADSDVVGLHVRLKPATRGMVTAADLRLMRPGSVLVNTSRAGLIAEGALLAGLNAGRPGMAAIDVFDEEPITWADDPLATHPNLIGTPHIGFVTEDEFEIQFADIFDQVVAWRDGAPINMINPEAMTP